MHSKILGLGLFVFGFVLAARFSYIEEYETPFGKTGTIIGIIICIIGLILMVK
jgi:hypothetical protein